eukprot:Nk52_evm1s2547 gene=Nk52_evmTU1s2547
MLGSCSRGGGLNGRKKSASKVAKDGGDTTALALKSVFFDIIMDSLQRHVNKGGSVDDFHKICQQCHVVLNDHLGELVEQRRSEAENDLINLLAKEEEKGLPKKKRTRTRQKKKGKRNKTHNGEGNQIATAAPVDGDKLDSSSNTNSTNESISQLQADPEDEGDKEEGDCRSESLKSTGESGSVCKAEGNKVGSEGGFLSDCTYGGEIGNGTLEEERSFGDTASTVSKLETSAPSSVFEDDGSMAETIRSLDMLELSYDDQRPINSPERLKPTTSTDRTFIDTSETDSDSDDEEYGTKRQKRAKMEGERLYIRSQLSTELGHIRNSLFNIYQRTEDVLQMHADFCLARYEQMNWYY